MSYWDLFGVQSTSWQTTFHFRNDCLLSPERSRNCMSGQKNSPGYPKSSMGSFTDDHSNVQAGSPANKPGSSDG